MFRFIVNVGLVLAVVFLVSIALVLVIKAFNWLIQWVAGQLGYEVGDFFHWAASHFPKRKGK